jgi:hypothetical protein
MTAVAAAEKELGTARDTLRGRLLGIAVERIDARLFRSEVPDISEELLFFASAGRFDLCKSLLGTLEEYVEARVHYSIASANHAASTYASHFTLQGDPEYLREGNR